MKFERGVINDAEIRWKGWGKYCLTLGHRKAVNAPLTPAVEARQYTRQQLEHLLAHLRREFSQSPRVVQIFCSNMAMTLPLDAARRIAQRIEQVLQQIDSGIADLRN